VKIHKVDCVSSVDEVMRLKARKAYQNINEGSFQTHSMYIERFDETYWTCKATRTKADPVEI
jgi:hypothetical protein